MNYEEFKDIIKKVLLENKDGLTWGQIRKKRNLPQKVPNNKWVAQLKKDIKLKRDTVTIWRI